MKVFAWIVVLGVVLIAMSVAGQRTFDANYTRLASASGHATPSAAWKTQFAALRDEGLQNIGWVAGNARGYSAWETVRPYVDEGGTYYNFFIRLGVPGEPQDIEAHHNLDLYAESVALGKHADHNESEEADRTKRLVAISTEIAALLKAN